MFLILVFFIMKNIISLYLVDCERVIISSTQRYRNYTLILKKESCTGIRSGSVSDNTEPQVSESVLEAKKPDWSISSSLCKE